MSELYLWRPHLKDCPHKGRFNKSCRCPVWVDGRVNGRRIRYSLETTSWERAEAKLDRILDPEARPRQVLVTRAIGDYLEDCRARNLAVSTLRSYTKTLEHLASFCSHEAYPMMESITLEALTSFRASRKGRNDKPAKASTLRKEIECLRAFFAFAVDRGWTPANLAKKLRPPKESGATTLPFEPEEVARILEAAVLIGNREHALMQEARARMSAFIGLLLYSGLRISDAAALARARLNETGHLLIRMMKTGAPLSVKLPSELVDDLLSLPKKSPYFFWSGEGKLSTVVGNLRATITRVLEIAKVTGHPHRFRDTFAVRLLEQDVPIRTVQLLLGHKSVRTTEKHYAPFLRSQQRLLDEAVAKLDLSSKPLQGESVDQGKPAQKALHNRLGKTNSAG